MKSLINLIILASLVSLAGFTVLRTQAEDIKPLIHQSKHFVLIFALPQHSNGGGNITYTNNLIMPIVDNSQTLNKVKDINDEGICPSKKGNEVYELTALFNDKLQVLLSFFNPQKNQNNLKEVVKDKESIQVVSGTNS